MTTPVTLTKKYRLRNGWEAEPLATDMGGDYPIAGRYRTPEGKWLLATWTADGQYARFIRDGHSHDLIEVPARVRIEGFCNVYRDADGNAYLHWYPTKERADGRRILDCIACIPPSRLADFEEGDGL